MPLKCLNSYKLKNNVTLMVGFEHFDMIIVLIIAHPDIINEHFVISSNL